MKCRNSKPVAKFRVGDRVQFESGGPKWRHTVWGTIVEVRGPIGINGRRLYFIDVPMDPDEPLRTVMEEDELEPDTISRVPLKKSEIIDFLKKRLPGIVFWNPSTEHEDPVVWLGRDSPGEITYTFSPRRGMIGGKLIPELALCKGRRIDARKKDEVAEFLL